MFLQAYFLGFLYFLGNLHIEQHPREMAAATVWVAHLCFSTFVSLSFPRQLTDILTFANQTTGAAFKLTVVQPVLFDYLRITTLISSDIDRRSLPSQSALPVCQQMPSQSVNEPPKSRTWTQYQTAKCTISSLSSARE